MLTYTIAYTANAIEHINKYLPKEIMLTKIVENNIFFRVYDKEYKHTFKRKELLKINTYHELALLIIDVISEHWKKFVYGQLFDEVTERD